MVLWTAALFYGRDRCMDKKEVCLLMEQLRQVFDIVRLVDVALMHQCRIERTGEVVREPYICYAVWRKDRRCENCISAKALACRKQVTKYEFVGSDVYYVISKYIEMDGEPFAMEMVSKVTDDTLFEAYGKDEFVRAIRDMNERLYIDPLTQTYNRRYYDEQLKGLIRCNDAVAMVDMDNFKAINDTYGHIAGDAALKAVADILIASSRSLDATDSVVRYGGDEFFVVYRNIAKGAFVERLERIRREVEETVLKEYPQIRFTVSVGGLHCPQNQTDVTQKADEALYRAKKLRNSVSIV